MKTQDGLKSRQYLHLHISFGWTISMYTEMLKKNNNNKKQQQQQQQQQQNNNNKQTNNYNNNKKRTFSRETKAEAESNRRRPLTSLTPYRLAKPVH